MLKHATINRTSRAQQTLQLQRQLNLQQSQSSSSSPTPTTTTAQPDHLAEKEGSQMGGNANQNQESDQAQLIDQLLKLSKNYNQSFQSIANNNKDDDDICFAQDDGQATPRSHTSSPIRSISSPLPSQQQSLLSTPTHKAHWLKSPPASHMSSPTSSPINTATALTLRPAAGAESTIKVFAQSLSQDVDYITFNVNAQTKSNQIIKSLLRKFRLKHRDPNLFYLTLERWIRKDGLKFKSIMLLGDEACPLQLQQCCSNPPHNDIKFTLQSRAGALVKIFCSDVAPDARYKCLSLSTQTTVEETIELMLHCLNLATQPPPRAAATTSSATSTTRDGHHTTITTITNLQCSHNNHQRHSGSPSSTSSSASCDSSASSSGIESEPNNNTCSGSCGSNDNRNEHSPVLPTISNIGLDVVDFASSHHNSNNSRITPSPMLDSLTRTSSVTSISSTSNVSNISTSITDQYCMIIECKDTNYKRALEHDEYLVDIYQNLLSEAKGQSPITSQYLDVATSNNLNLSEPIKQQPEQWFHIKLKRRDHCSHNTIKFTSPRQNLPLPPIPLSLAQQFNNANNLQQIVSFTQIEVNRRPTNDSSGLTNFKVANGDDMLLCDPSRSLIQTQTQPPATRARAPPPPKFISLPPVRPRRRNLSNASSTFGRPLTANRRRYDPAQLVEDLKKLNVKEVAAATAESAGGGQMLAANR